MQVIDCGEVLDISVIKPFQTKLLEALMSTEPIHLNGQGLQRVDGAGLQLLVVLFREAAAKHGSVTWQSTSPALIAAAQHMGVTRQLALTHGSA